MDDSISQGVLSRLLIIKSDIQEIQKRKLDESNLQTVNEIQERVEMLIKNLIGEKTRKFEFSSKTERRIT